MEMVVVVWKTDSRAGLLQKKGIEVSITDVPLPIRAWVYVLMNMFLCGMQSVQFLGSRGIVQEEGRGRVGGQHL